MYTTQPTWMFTVPPHPPVFYAHKISSNEKPLQIDGNILEKSIWENVPWSDPFSEIRGSYEDNHGDPKLVPPVESTPKFHHCQTRMKMLWDDDFLYVAALLEYGVPVTDSGNDVEIPLLHKKRVSEIIATYTERNSPIFHEDSDFEVFIDPTASCQDYKELEMNAMNTVWNLMLDKPYDVGGQEHSARKDVSSGPSDDRYYEVEHQESAAKVVSGRINETSGRRQYLAWTVEIKMAHSDTLKKTKSSSSAEPSSFPDSYKPQIGNHWRINFSHVEWKGDINWVWSPQLSWDPKEKVWRGFVAMHRPEAWGYVYFLDSKTDSDLVDDKNHAIRWKDPLWEIRSVAVMIYYELRHYKDKHDKYVDNLIDLGIEDSLKKFEALQIQIKIIENGKDDGFLVSVEDKNIGLVTITNDEKISSALKFSKGRNQLSQE